MFEKLLAAFTLSLCAAVSATAASITNGEFENGNLNGWTVSTFNPRNEISNTTPEQWGYAAAVGSSPTFPPIQGAYSAVLAANEYRISSCGDLFNVSCPSYPPTGIPSAPLGGAALAYPPFLRSVYNGAYIGQDVTAHAGDILSWTWKWEGDASDMMFAWITNGTSAFYVQGRASAAFFAEVDPMTQRFLSARTITGLTPGESWDAYFPISADGLWTIYFGIAQTADNQGSSWMQLDNVRLGAAVPEPTTAALLVAGLWILWISRRGRREFPSRP